MSRSSSWALRPTIALMTASCFIGALAAYPSSPAHAVAYRPAAPRATCTWKVVRAPSPGVGTATLNGIDAISPRNIWAVGGYDAAGATLVEHWNGHTWKVVKSPNRSGFTQLEAVAAVTPRNVWAVGFFVPRGGSNPRTLIVHWNGKRWTNVKSPNPLKGTNVLFGVDAASAKAVYAVGTNNLGAGAGSKQITLRWAGGHWRNTANLSGTSAAEDVAAFSTSNALAVGHVQVGVSDQPLVEAFDGSRWSRLSTSSSLTGPDLADLSAREAGVQWAVGSQSVGPALQTLTMHKTPAGWETVPSADSSPTQINQLYGVVALPKQEAWAVGYHETASFTRRTLIEHYQSGTWSIVPSPNGTKRTNELLDIAAAGGNLWAVGYAFKAVGGKVLVESRRCSGS